MKFKLNVLLDDKDYYEFNKIYFLKTKSGKYFKRVFMLIYFVLLVLICLLNCISLVNSNDPNVINKIIGYILYYLLVFIFLYVMLGCLLKLFIWIEIKIRRKLSQLKYDESAVVKFYDDKICEKTENTTTELSYAFINSIYIIKDKAIYMLANNGLNCIIPYKTFKSKKQYDDFIEYLYKIIKPNYKMEFVELEK